MPVGELLGLKLLDGAIGWAVGRVGDSAGKRLKSALSNSAARRELVHIGDEAVEAAAIIAPELAADLRSEVYLHHVLAPALLALLQDPTAGMDPERAADAYVRRFVEPYLRGRDVNDVLSQVFQLEPERLTAAFAALIDAARSRMYTSTHWRERIAAVALEEVRMGVRGIQKELAAQHSPTADLDDAREDARVASEGLRSWPQTVAGLHLDRPELSQLRERVRASPESITLVTGAAGAGKSALLAELTANLEHDGVTVFAIKADQLPETVRNLRDIARALGIAGDLVAEIDALARDGPVVLVIDQLDAVSEVMDRTSRRMQLLLQLATRWRRDGSMELGPPVHVIVSSRPFEARHDARFQSLRAEEIRLALPPWAAIGKLLEGIGLDPEATPEPLREALRRPFLLKLFVEIVGRGEPATALVEGELLNAWLRTAPLGDKDDRREVLDLLKALASEMTATETLWRPADKFEQNQANAVRRAEACELLVRRAGLLGFAHQSWLDDFQARAFGTAAAVAEHAWSTQDGLFGRATILRALERLRAYEPSAYAEAIDALLGDGRTRRHLRHLTVDLIATQTDPLEREKAWVLRLLWEDAVLARRAVGKLVANWAAWRMALKPSIAAASAIPDLAYSAAAMTIAEVEIDSAEAERLLLTIWPAPRDEVAFEVCWRGGLWSPAIRARLAQIFAQAPYAGHAISDYATRLREGNRAAEAADLVGLYLQSLTIKTRDRVSLHEVEKIADAVPDAFVKAVLPWFLDLVGSASEEVSGSLHRYPQSNRLPFDWQDDDGERNVFGALRNAINACALGSPATFRAIVKRLSAVELDEAQALVAEAYGTAGARLANDAVAWLLADTRRLSVGLAHVRDEDNVGRLQQDYSTRELLKGVAAHLGAERLSEVVAAIEQWDPYTKDGEAESTADDRRRWRRWAEENRANLLALLPEAALTPRRRRQVRELLAKQPRIRPGRGAGMASFVPSPMGSAAMSRATDDDLFRMIDEVNDDVGDRRLGERGREMGGGVSQLSQAFGAFGKNHPGRAMALVRARFEPGRHEQAAGALIRELRDVATVSPEDLLELIWELHRRGFATEDWRRDAAWAMETIAGRSGGLRDDAISLLDSWIVRDPDVIADRVARRERLDLVNREQNTRGEIRPAPMLFGRGLGGSIIMPQGNFCILAAMAVGVLLREPSDRDSWLKILERHVADPEDPHVWAFLILTRGGALFAADRDRVFALFDALWTRFPASFEPTTARTLWPCRQMLPPTARRDIGLGWLASPDAKARQLAGEFFLAGWLVDQSDVEAKLLSEAILAGPEGPSRTGAFFAAAAAWPEEDPGLRRASHSILEPAARQAHGDVAEAISTALSANRTLPPDEFTRQLLGCAAANPSLLAACLNGRFLDALQGLLLHPGFEELVLTVAEASLDILLQRQQGRGAMVNGDLVSIAVTLQRAQSERRVRAMDLYERLLDIGLHDADQAAQDSLRR